MSGMLRVNLSAGSVRTTAVPDGWLERYVGGKGLGARYLYEELEAGVDPKSPENVLLFMVGPLTGYTPGEPRYAAITKSPLTGAFLDSYSGGRFAARLAGSLADHLGVLITGRADKPVTLSIDDGDVTVESAADLQGLDAVETSKRFPDAAVACIGPAGERGVRYATIASDAGDHHAGRGGAGTVMGSKNLKAVVARGSEPDGLEGLRDRYAEAYAKSDTGRWLAVSDTLETVDYANAIGVLPTRGWQATRFEGAEGIGIEAARERSHARERPDDAVPGGFKIESEDGESVPRGATPIVLGAGLGIDDFDAVATLGAVCDRLAMDVITAGNAVAWAIRASQQGVIDRDLSFGDEERARKLIEEIATRSTPLGDALADGLEAAADRFGGETLIPTIKGMDLSSYDPRRVETMALAYSTSDRGACHRRARPIELEPVAGSDWRKEKRVRTVIDEQNRRATLWSLIADDFLEDVFEEDLGAEWLDALGYTLDSEDLGYVGERVWTLIRLFNLREGFSRADDRLPKPLLEPGPNGEAIDPAAFDDLLEQYYTARGWDRHGRPTHQLLDRLDLAAVVDEETPVGTSVGNNTHGRDG